jgi:transposase
MKTYSMEFRHAVAVMYDECGSSTVVAKKLKCSASWVRRLIQNRRERGTLEPKPLVPPDTSKLDDQDLLLISDTIKNKPNITLAELAKVLSKTVCLATIHNATVRLGLSRKKRQNMPPSRIAQT